MGVFHADDIVSREKFCAWAMGTGRPWLTVEIRAGEALIGPLTLPGRAGCDHCARERMVAAAQSHPSAVVPPPLAGIGGAAAWVLVREVRAILRRSAGASPLLNHVLVVASPDEGSSWVTSFHRVIPLSHCPVCGGAARHVQENPETSPLSAEDSPEIVLAALGGWVDPRTGVISRIVVEQPGDLGVEVPVVVTAAPPHVRGENGSLKRLPIGWGKGLTLSGALLSAVGEAIERYAPSLPDPAQIVWECPHDLAGEFLDPRQFPLYTEKQYNRVGFPYVRFDPNVRHPWVRGRWLGNGAPVWVPAVFVFLAVTVRAEHLICQGTSNGLAASTNFEDAALRATMELVERDAFMAAWLTQCAGRRVELDRTLNPLLRSVVDGVVALGAVVEVYLLPTSACGTTALCLALGDGEQYPGVTIGLGTDLDPRWAIRQAILELGQTGPHLRRLMRTKQITAPVRPSSVKEMLDHAAYFFPVKRAAAFDWLRSRAEPMALRHLPQAASTRSLAKCAAELRAAKIRVTLIDVTSPDVATGPFRVVRAISPDLQPISYGYGYDYKPSERIRQRGLASHVPAIHPIW